MDTQINLNDFALAVNLIDTCTERGAFKGNELMVVGQLREKFATFVKNAQAQNETKENSEVEENGEAE